MTRLLALIVLSIPSLASATKYAGEPYYLGVGGRALALGGTAVASRVDASSPFWNPAALASLTRSETIFQHAETFGSLLDHDFLGAAIQPGVIAERWAFGAYVSRLGGGGIQLTEYDSATERPVVSDEASHSNWAIAASASREFGAWGSVGLTAKALINRLPDNSAWGLGLDLAWWKDWTGVRTGIKLADATSTFLSYDSGEKETIIPHVNWGAEADLPQFVDELRLTVAAESETYFEGRRNAAEYWSGSVSVDTHLGFEAAYKERLFGRVGSDKGQLSLGAGFALGRWVLDGALTNHEFLDSSYRFSLRLLWP